MTMRTEGLVLLGCRDGAYWFATSVFEHRDDFRGATGCILHALSKDAVNDLLDPDSVQESYYDHWEDYADGEIMDDCEDCADSSPTESGCDYCGYKSLADFCREVIERDGLSAMIDESHCEGRDQIADVADDVEAVDCSGGGRIFASFGREDSLSVDDFDEVYNRKALVAVLAYEDDAVDYDYAARVVFGE